MPQWSREAESIGEIRLSSSDVMRELIVRRFSLVLSLGFVISFNVCPKLVLLGGLLDVPQSAEQRIGEVLPTNGI